GPRPRQPPLQSPRRLHDRPPHPGPHLRLPRRARRPVPPFPLPAAQRILLPHHHHHGVLPLRLPRGLRPHPRRQTHRPQPPQALERRSALSPHHLQDRHPLFPPEALRPPLGALLSRRLPVVR